MTAPPDRFNGRRFFASMTGLSENAVQQAWDAAKVNLAKLQGCARHQVEPPEETKAGMKLTCKNCGGTMGLNQISEYIRGYEAAGKSADDIWPGYRDTKRDVAL